MISYLKTQDPNYELFYRFDRTKNAKATIIIVHGFAEHLGRYAHVSNFFTENGYNVLVYDQRGHGQSKGSRGYVESFHDFIKDLDHMVRFAKILEPHSPVITLGHSMGGLISFLYGLEFPNALQSQIFTGAALGIPLGVTGPQRKILETLVKISPTLQVRNVIDEEICSVDEVVEAYKNDPLVLSKVSINLLNEFINKSIPFAIEWASEYNYDALFLHGEQDKVISYESTQRVYNHIQSQNKEYKIYKKLYHEILNEKHNKLILDDIVIWLEQSNQ